MTEIASKKEKQKRVRERIYLFLKVRTKSLYPSSRREDQYSKKKRFRIIFPTTGRLKVKTNQNLRQGFTLCKGPQQNLVRREPEISKLKVRVYCSLQENSKQETETKGFQWLYLR